MSQTLTISKRCLTIFEKVVYFLSEGLDITVTITKLYFRGYFVTFIEFIGVLVVCTLIDTHMIEEEALKHNLIIMFSL